MQMMQLICPQCRANLSVSSDMKQAFCMYCGNKIIISNENEYIYRSVDEARLLEAQNERMRLEYEIKQKREKEEKKAFHEKVTITFIVLSLLCLFIGLFAFIFSPALSLFGLILFPVFLVVGAVYGILTGGMTIRKEKE